MTFLRSTVLVIALTLGLAACGSDSSDPTAGETRPQDSVLSEPPTEKPATDGGGGGSSGSKDGDAENSAQHGPEKAESPSRRTADFTPPAHRDSGGGAVQFQTKGGDNSVQESGTEASDSDFAEAAAVLHAYLDARAAGAWAASCEYLAPALIAQLAQLAAGEGGGENARSCPHLLASFSAGLPRGVLREAAIADVGAVRIDGDSAFLLFKGAQGVDYFIPMMEESGGWKVAAVAASALP